MKKVISILLIILVLSSFVGCNSIPEGMPEYTYNIGVEALNVTDQYLDFKITKDEAYKNLDELSNRLNSLNNNDMQTLFVQTDLSSICWELVSVDGSDSEIIRLRNDLAKTLAMPEKNL